MKLLTWLVYPVAWLFAKLFYKGDGVGARPMREFGCDCGAPRCEREGCQDKPTPVSLIHVHPWWRLAARLPSEVRQEDAVSHIHINYGRARRKSEPDETCMYCDRHAETMAYTYFGAPVCGACWDSNWRKTEDGDCDPPFNEIHNQVSGEWLS